MVLERFLDVLKASCIVIMAFGVQSETGLKRITEEKLLLRNIGALEQSIYEETNPQRKQELNLQMNGLRNTLSRLSGSTFVNYKPKKQEVSQTKISIETNEGISKLYRTLLERYSELINENERKTVGEIKALITKDDLTIQSLTDSFKIDNYKFQNHYFQAGEKAYKYVINEIDYVETDLNISFWLSPKEIVEQGIGDDEDQAVFLCSLLYSLGDEKAQVVIAELENATPHAFVITEFNNKFLLLDPTQKKPFREYFGQKNGILDTYAFNGSKIKKFLYKFNHNNYEQFQD